LAALRGACKRSTQQRSYRRGQQHGAQNGGSCPGQKAMGGIAEVHLTSLHADPVCTENLNPNVLTMKSAQYGARIYDARSLNLARDRRIFVQ
jgi:hypothetical protein